MAKISTRQELSKICEELRKQKKSIGFTSGTFDLLHPGHTQYLEEAKNNCDVLIVGVNSDSSVQEYKGPSRPICPEASRATVLAALKAVDYVFIFSEVNNNQNINALKPDLYIKAGDYTKQKLTSASLVEAYGGKVLVVNFKPGFSSSAIIDKIQALVPANEAQSMSAKPYQRAPAVFLDRDGTINEHIEYLHEIEKFQIIPGALDAMKKLKLAGYRLVIVTNQPGIGVGYFSKEDFFKVNRELLKAASKAGFNIDRIYYCPHTRADECDCRKPKPGMLLRAVTDLNVDLSKSFMVGDMSSDVKAGADAGCKTVVLKTGQGGADGLYDVKPDYVANDLAEAAELILRNSKP